MKIALSDILPNPYRSYNVNPINKLKIEKLVESIQETGLWGVIVRPSPTSPGKYEQAFGHHRLEAARQAGLKEAEITVQDLSNEQMIMMLARDNDEVYDSSVLSVIESVHGVVKGLADGSLKPLEIPSDTKSSLIRYAPSFIPGEPLAGSANGVRYTSVGIGKLLGYTKKAGKYVQASNAVEAALGALWLMQIGQLKVTQIANLSVDALRIMVQEAIGRVNQQRKLEAERAKAEADRLQVEQEQKALREEQEAIAAEAKKKKQAAEQKKREAEEAENEKAIEEAEAKRKKAVDDEALRTLKAHAKAADKALTKYGAPSVAEGAAIEKAVQKANEALEAKDVKSAEKLTEQLSKLSRSVTDKYLTEQKAASDAADQARKELPTRNAVKTILHKLEVFPSEGYALRKELSALERNGHVTVNERELVRQALLLASDWFNKQAELFLPPIKENVLAEAEKKAKKASPAFEQDSTDKSQRIQSSLDEAAEKRRAEREQENAELEKSTTTKRRKKK